jgi:hypothetical protein
MLCFCFPALALTIAIDILLSIVLIYCFPLCSETYAPIPYLYLRIIAQVKISCIYCKYARTCTSKCKAWSFSNIGENDVHGLAVGLDVVRVVRDRAEDHIESSGGCRVGTKCEQVIATVDTKALCTSGTGDRVGHDAVGGERRRRELGRNEGRRVTGHHGKRCGPKLGFRG